MCKLEQQFIAYVVKNLNIIRIRTEVTLVTKCISIFPDSGIKRICHRGKKKFAYLIRLCFGPWVVM